MNFVANPTGKYDFSVSKVWFFNIRASDASIGTLEVTGFLRGVPLNVNNLVHIPGLGDFQMNRIDAASDIYRMDKNR